MTDPLPGCFRRRIRIEPGTGRVRAALEDDFHCMAVILHHDGVRISGIEADMDRAPWTTCPGARAVLETTFRGTALADAARRGEKQANCTHLYDLAVLAAAHAADGVPLVYDIEVSDPVDGLWHAAISTGSEVLVQFSHCDNIVIQPDEITGTSLFGLRGWIEALPEPQREAARLLQWAAILAHGRVIPMERQSDASVIPPNCFTFQPERKGDARRVGRVIDFSASDAAPLDHLGPSGFAPRAG